jgi:hypothetical protein
MIADLPELISRHAARAASMLLSLWLAYWPCQTMAGPDAAVDVVLVLDNSQATGSADPERRLVALLDELIKSLAPDARVGLIAFDDLATPVVPLTRLADGGSEQIIDALETLGFAAAQSNYAAGLERAIYELTQKADINARRVILLNQSSPIAVGDAEKDQAFRRWAVEVLAGKAADAGIELWVISLGPDADPALGSTLAERTKGVAVDSASAGELPGAIAALRQRLNQTGPAPEPFETVAAASPALTGAQSSPPEIDVSPLPEPVPEVTGATADREPAPQSVEIDELDQLPEPAAGAVKTLAAKEKSPAGREWPSDPDRASDRKLSPISPDPPIRQAVAVAAVVLMLIAAAIWYRRRPRHSHPLAATAAKAPARAAHLIDVGGVTGRSSYTLGDKLARVSRMPGTDTDNVVTIHIPEDVISRSHAFIELRRGAYWVTDPGSNNGTFVNGKRIDGSSQLKHGDVIKFASHEFRFEYPAGGGAAADREVAVGRAQDDGQAATTVYAGGAADSRTMLAPQRADLQKAGATGADTDQDPTVVRPAS